jgi:hypothetical protein
LLNDANNIPLENVSVLAGIAVNTSPIPDYLFGNLKLQWCPSPMFLAKSMVINLEYETRKIRIRDPFEIEIFDGLLLSYIFRFSSGQFILLCWNGDKTLQEKALIHMGIQYPYTILTSNSNEANLNCVTNEITYHHFHLIEVNWGNGIMNEISVMRRSALGKEQYDRAMRELSDAWLEEEKKLAAEHKR